MTFLNFLKPLTKITYAIASLGLMVSIETAAAQDEVIIYQPDPDSPIGERNKAGAPELAQYDFLIGDWDAEITWYPPGQEPFQSILKWHNHWVANGRVVMLEWRGPMYTCVEIRQWSPLREKWIGFNACPDYGVTEATSEFIDGKMYVTIPGQEGPGGPYINRETYYDIAADSYKMKSEHSFDEGETWERGFYEMTVWRTSKED